MTDQTEATAADGKLGSRKGARGHWMPEAESWGESRSKGSRDRPEGLHAT